MFKFFVRSILTDTDEKLEIREGFCGQEGGTVTLAPMRSGMEGVVAQSRCVQPGLMLSTKYSAVIRMLVVARGKMPLVVTVAGVSPKSFQGCVVGRRSFRS